MLDVTYEIVQHGNLLDSSEALAAARAASAEQEIPGHAETIEYEDDKGRWQKPPAAETVRTPLSRTWIELFSSSRSVSARRWF